MGCCLMVIDLQNGVFELKRPIYHERALMEQVETAVRFARDRGMPIIFSLHENNSFLRPGTPGHRIRDGMTMQQEDIVIRKKQPDVFTNTNLEDILEQKHVDTVMIAGLISNGCVKQACLTALDKGYRVVLIKDAHSTFYSGADRMIEQTNCEMEAAGVRTAAAGELPAIMKD